MSSHTLVEGSNGGIAQDPPTLSQTELEAIRLNEERAAIVEKYDRGREKGAIIDPWEDPAFEVYHKIDYYGFIHDERLPAKPNTHEKKVLYLETERQTKWVKMLKNWEKYTEKKLRSRTFKGIPKSVKGAAWAKFLDLETIKLEQKGKYEEMKSLAREYSPDIRQIDLDVNRTYRDHYIFRERYGIKQQALFHVLGAYSMYNTEIGYCQGMSQIVALFLMFFNDEEDAFWALSVLMSNPTYNMHGFFIPGFPKLLRFQDHHEKIMKTKLPKLNNHIKKHRLDNNMYTLKWYFQCFLDRVPFSLALRLWDVFLLEGDRILIAQSYNILKLHRSTLSRFDMEGMLDFLQVKLEKDFIYDDDTVMLNLDKCLVELKKVNLDHPGPPPAEELPQKPFGLFIKPETKQPIKGHAELLSPEERDLRESLMRPQDLELIGGLRDRATATNLSRISLGGVSKYSCDPSIDDVSSIVGAHSSQTSLAATSVTSLVELSSLTLNTNFSFTHLAMENSDFIMSEELCSSAPPSVVPRRKLNGTENNMATPSVSGRSTPTPVSDTFRPSKLYFDNGDIAYDGLVGREDEPSTPKISEEREALRIYVEYKGTQDGPLSRSPAGAMSDRSTMDHYYDKSSLTRSENRSSSGHSRARSSSGHSRVRSSSGHSHDRSSLGYFYEGSLSSQDRSTAGHAHHRLSAGVDWPAWNPDEDRRSPLQDGLTLDFPQDSSNSNYGDYFLETHSTESTVSGHSNALSSPGSLLNDPNKITIKVSHPVSKLPSQSPIYAGTHHHHFYHHQTRYLQHRDDVSEMKPFVMLSDNL